MTYASQSSLENQFGARAVLLASDRDKNGVADAGVLARAFSGADGIIDSRIGVVYKLPLQVIPDVLVEYAGHIAMYLMSADTGTYTEEKRQRYEDAIAWLDRLAAGKAVLPGQPEEPKTKAAGGIRMTVEAREYTVGKTRGIL